MKILAMYLPQFHRTPENDQWWGEGFTDWDAVKRARPLYDGHEQPKIPLDNFYYDLLKKSTMQWQAELMHQYGIDGMCIYHYWFKDGRRVLEKPAENLLKWTDIDMPFCFCWANETWARTWSHVPEPEKNVWADTFENNQKRDGDGILLQQAYGLEDAWIDHFNYLLPFFRDERYIKIGGKPVFCFYHPERIPCLSPMIDCWQELAKENGFPGIYTYGSFVLPEQSLGLDEVFYHEPVIHKIILDQKYGKYGHAYSYDELWENILSHRSDEKVSWGGVVSYDDTPRRGDSGYRLDGFTTEKFRTYFAQLLDRNIREGCEITFLNAWNEWGEGMYLEPDMKHGYRMLEAVADARKDPCERADAEEDNLFCDKYLRQILYQEKDTVYLHLLHNWMRKREHGKRISKWLLSHSVNSITVYGYGIFGEHLVTELKEDAYPVHYLIDREKTETNTDLQVFHPDESLPDADAVVVTTPTCFEEVYRQFHPRFGFRIISLRQIIEEL